MTPDPTPGAGTPLGFRLQEIPACCEKLLDSQPNKDYQGSRFEGFFPLLSPGQWCANTFAPSFPGNKKSPRNADFIAPDNLRTDRLRSSDYEKFPLPSDHLL